MTLRRSLHFLCPLARAKKKKARGDARNGNSPQLSSSSLSFSLTFFFFFYFERRRKCIYLYSGRGLQCDTEIECLSSLDIVANSTSVYANHQTYNRKSSLISSWAFVGLSLFLGKLEWKYFFFKSLEYEIQPSLASMKILVIPQCSHLTLPIYSKREKFK